MLTIVDVKKRIQCYSRIIINPGKTSGIAHATALILISLLYTISANAGNSLGNVGDFTKWAKIEIPLEGPQSDGSGVPNPFNIFVDVTFTSPGGKSFIVPGFYDGDGKGNLNGKIWKVRFSADEVGTWTFTTKSKNSKLNEHTGSFVVLGVPATAPDFYKWGRLEHMGTPDNNIRYLKFRDGPYWLKAGSDDKGKMR